MDIHIQSPETDSVSSDDRLTQSPETETGSSSPIDQIRRRLALIGVPEEYLDTRYYGLVDFVKANRSWIQEVVSAILPTHEEVAEALKEAKARSKNSPTSPTMEADFRESMEWLQWLMFEGEPSQALRNLAEKTVGQRGVCGAVWGSNDIAYRCRTCENDPTCAICAPCFRNGNHKDHDISVIYTGGGCCDCGDETAWKRAGFCSKHKGAEQIQPLPETLAYSVGPILEAIFVCWKDRLLSIENTCQEDRTSRRVPEHEKMANELTFILVEKLLEFCMDNESLLSFISKMIASVGLLDILVRAEKYLSETVVQKLHEFLLKLLAEPNFKYEFAKVFVSYYPVAINEIIRDFSDTALKKYPLLSMFSVQIFTVPTLTPKLVKEMDLFLMLLGCLGDIFISSAGEDGRLQAAKWRILYETTNRVIGDIKFVMSHSVVSKYALNEGWIISRTWLRLLSFVQEMNPLKRETGIHIEEENDSIHFFFVLGHSVAVNNSLLVDGSFSVSSSEERDDWPIIRIEERDTDDQDEERHAKVGRLSQESSVCSTPSTIVSKDAGASIASSGNSVPSSATWLIHECLRVLENCLGDDEGVSGALRSVCSPGTGIIFSSSLLGRKRTLSKIGKEKSILPRVAGSSQGISTVFSPVLSDTPSSMDLDSARVTASQSNIVFPRRKDSVACTSSDLDNSTMIEDSAAESDAFCFLSLSDWPAISYDVGSQDVSVHIPLHRLISLLLQIALRKCYGESVAPSTSGFDTQNDFFEHVLRGCHPYGFAAFVMEHPLRIRVFSAQVNAGMWRKNGDVALVSCEWYRSTRWSEQGLEHDLFLLQCCAALAPADLYVSRIVERFGLLNYLSLSLEQAKEFEPTLVQEMLTLIIHILQERRFCGLSTAESLRRELVCRLAVGDTTHSQLVKTLPRELSKFEQLQDMVDSVSVYSKPSHFNQGMYSLRSSCWKELDLYHPRWNSRDLQVAEERYSRFTGMQALTTQLPRWTKIYPPLSGLSGIATCKVTLQIIRAVVYYALFNDSTESRAPDGVLITALHLLSLALDISFQNTKYGSQQLDSGNSFPLLVFAGEEIDEGFNYGAGRQSLLSLLVSLMRIHKKDHLNHLSEADGCDISSWIEKLLRKFADIDSGCKTKLQYLAPEVVSHLKQPAIGLDINMSGSATDTEKRKAQARERQAAILEKIKAEQSKFLSSIEADVDGCSDSESEASSTDVGNDSEDTRQEVCCLCHDSDSKIPVSYLILVQKSRVLSFADIGPPSWEQSRRSEKEVCSSSYGAFDRSGMTVYSDNSEGSTSLGLVELAENSFQAVMNDQRAEVNPFLGFFRAHFLSPRNNQVESTSVVGIEITESTLEILEQDIYLSIRNKMSCNLQCNIMTQEHSENSGAGGGPISTTGGGQSVLLDKYIDILSREMGKDPSASKNAQSNSKVGESTSQAVYDGFGLTDCDGVHLSSCGHAVHQGCLNRYLSSLRDRSARRNVFEGAHIADPDKGEVLCPVCRRLANSVLPASPVDSKKTWKQHVATLVASGEKTRSLQLSQGLCILQSAADVIGQRDVLEAFPQQGSEHTRPDLELASRALSRMYFSKAQDKFPGSRVSQSIIMWDTLKYSLISMEIASRCGKASPIPVYNLDSLYEELKSSGGYILSLLLRVIQSTGTKNALHVLQRYRGIQLFSESICSGISVDYPSSESGQKGKMLKYVRPEVSSAELQFWNRASGPVLAREPFSSLMWVLFCLPFPFLSCKESLLSIVHIFYAVSLIQAVIAYCEHCQCISDLSAKESLVTDVARFLRESGGAKQYFVSNIIDSSCDMKDTIRRLTFPYLRRCALLWRLLYSAPGPFCEKDDTVNDRSYSMMDSVSESQSELNEILELEKLFKIPPIDIVLSDELLRSSALKWFNHFQTEFEINRIQGLLYINPAVPFRLMKLPHAYQELLQRYIKQCCPDCKKVIEEPALCLLCGRLCCPSWKPCCRESRCQTHATTCGAGIGVFLLIKKTTILLQRSTRQAPWPSPYLDAFGEEDLEMYRGKPLYLNEERYAALTYMVASHGLDRSSKVLGQTTIASFLIL